jgi:hypothetical protein
MQRTRSGRRVAVTRRDIEIFTALSHYRYLRSMYLHAFAGGASETRFKERLGDLFHEGFINRPSQQWQFADARCMPVVYEIDERAKRALNEYGGAEVPPRTFLAPTAHRQFAHSLLICECLASIELAALAKPGIRFIPWPEILARAPESTRSSAVPFRIPASGGTIIPDGLFGLEYDSGVKKSYRFLALEIDRGTMPLVRSIGNQTSYLRKLAAYQEIIERQLQKTHLGVSTLFVLTVMTDKKRQAETIRLLDKQGGGPQFLFKSISQLVRPAPRSFWSRGSAPDCRRFPSMHKFPSCGAKRRACGDAGYERKRPGRKSRPQVLSHGELGLSRASIRALSQSSTSCSTHPTLHWPRRTRLGNALPFRAAQCAEDSTRPFLAPDALIRASSTYSHVGSVDAPVSANHSFPVKRRACQKYSRKLLDVCWCGKS